MPSNEIEVTIRVDGGQIITTEVVSATEWRLRLLSDTGEVALVGDPHDLVQTVVDLDRSLTRTEQAQEDAQPVHDAYDEAHR